MGIKVGYLPLYIKLYDDDDPHMRDPMIAYMRHLIAELEARGLEIAQAPVCRIKEEFDAAAAFLNSADVCCVITQNLAYSPSLESLTALLSLNAPIVVFDTTPDCDLSGRAATYNGIDPNHGIHGVQDLCSMLKRNNRTYTLCVGHEENSDVLEQVVSACRSAAAAYALKHAKVGSAGGSFEGMGDFLISPDELKRLTGAEVEYLTKEEACGYGASVTEEDIDREQAADRADFTWEVKNEEYYRTEAKSALVLRKWVEAKQLSAATVNFLKTDECGLPTMPFVECSRMMARGIGYAGEGDVLTAALVGALMKVYGNRATFTEMFCPDWKHHQLLLSHMGEANLAQAAWKPVLRDEPFGYNCYGHTAAAYIAMKPGPAVLVNLAPLGKRLSMIVTPVEMTDCALEDGAYRYAEQGWMKPCMPLPEFLKAFSELGGTHHSALVYEASVEEIAAFGRMMNFDVAVIQ